MTNPRPKKRSVIISGHATSISLEDEFWQELQAIARERGQTISQLLSDIDQSRGRRSLSSAARIFVLRWLKRKISGARPPEA